MTALDLWERYCSRERRNMAVRIVERRPFEHVGGEEARVVVPEHDRIEIQDEAANWTLTIQDDGRGHVEVSVLEGRVTLYT